MTAGGTRAEPTLALERQLLRGRNWLIGLDEVGRGAVAGPVSVGAVAVDARTVAAGWPAGLRDSKLLRPARRSALAPVVRDWAPAVAVGHREAAEVDREGIIRSLQLAAVQALRGIEAAGVPVSQALLLLDGAHDWLSGRVAAAGVVVRPKADRDCVVVAAASVLAKVERDELMTTAHQQPGLRVYGWDANKGYGTPGHLAAIRQYGACDWHRRSWLHDSASPGLTRPGAVT